MHVGLFIDTYYPMVDGVINVVDNYARVLSQWCDVTVFAPEVKGYDDSQLPYRVVRSLSVPLGFMDYELPAPLIDYGFRKDVRHSELDIVHIHSPFGIAENGIRYARKHNIPVVATLHSQFKYDLERNIPFSLRPAVDLGLSAIMSTFNRCDECWAVNSEIQNLFEQEYGLKKPCRVMLNATRHKPVADPEAAAAEINERFGLQPDETVFLFIGRINFLKNLDFLSRSLKILKDRGHKFKMLFVGAGLDELRLEKLLAELELQDCAIMCGRIAEIPTLEKLYSRAKLFLFPSLYDANSLVQIEAAAQGTPTVFLKGARTAATVTPEVNGFIAEPDELAYAMKIEEILSNPEHYQAVSQAASKDLYRSWDTAVKEAYERYESLIQMRNPFMALSK